YQGNGGDGISPGDLQASVRCERNPSDPSRWEIGLRVELPECSDRKFQYCFVIDLVGSFRVVDSTNRDLETLVRINGPAILYSAAREILAMVTARRSPSAVLLPSSNFLPSGELKDSSGGVAVQDPHSRAEFGFPGQRLEFARRYQRLIQ